MLNGRNVLIVHIDTLNESIVLKLFLDEGNPTKEFLAGSLLLRYFLY